MPIFGCHAFVWNGNWDNEIAADSIAKTAAAGFDLIEIPLLRPAEVDAARIKNLLAQHGIRGVTSLALPKEAHLPFYPQQAAAFLRLAVEKTAEMGSDTLAGCLYCNLGTQTGAPPTEAELQTCADVLGEIARYAQGYGIRLGLEPVNRYETYLLNVGEDTAKLIARITAGSGADNLFIHFDTYHMNIEEHGFAAAIQQANSLAGYIHMSESGRGIPGEGNVGWDDVFAGLKAIDFRGPLTLEAFAAINPDLTAATCLWRPGSFDGQQLAERGLAFLRRKAAEHGLN